MWVQSQDRTKQLRLLWNESKIRRGTDKGSLLYYVEYERIFEKGSRQETVEKPMALGLEVRLEAVAPSEAA
jgi:hypothetical protein